MRQKAALRAMAPRRGQRRLLLWFATLVVGVSVAVVSLGGCQTLLIYAMMAWGIDTDYRIKDRQWLEQRLAAAMQKPDGAANARPLTYGVAASIMIGQVGDLNGDIGSLHSYGFNVKMLDVLKELPLDVIRVGGLDDTWRVDKRDENDLADRLMERVRQTGWKVMIADTQHSAHLLSNPVTWEEFQAIHLRRIEFLARRYRPQYYAVATEVSTYHAFGVKGKINVDRWVEQTRAALALVRRIDPAIRTAVIIGPEKSEEQEFYRKVLRLPDLDIIAVEVYYPHDLEIVDRLIREHPRTFGKQLWVGESWSGMPTPHTNVPDKEDEDEKWVKLITGYARRNDFDAVLFWPFQYFVTYQKYDPTKRLPDFAGRTRPFRTYQQIVKDAKRS